MSVTSLLEKIAGVHRQRQQEKHNTYRELVASVASGKEPNATEVERTLEAAGKSVDDLQHDVEAYQHRMALKAIVASVPKLESEQAKLRNQIDAADKVLEDAERQHDEVTSPLYFRLHEIKEALSDASSARRELFHTCDDPDLRSELAQLNAEITKLSQQRQELQQRASYMATKAENELVRANSEANEADMEHRREQAAKYQHQANLARRDIAALEKANVKLVTQREQIEERMRRA